MALTNCRKNLVIPPEKLRTKKLYTFGRFSATSRLNDEYLRKESSHGQPGKTTKDPPTVFRNFTNFSSQTAKMGSSYLSALRKCCMLLLCQPSQAEVTEQNSTKFCDVS